MAFSVKVCGIQTLEEAKMAAASGADYLGFLLGLTHTAEDKTTPEAAAAMIQSLKNTASKAVMVTHLLDAEHISEIATRTGVHAIQIHDDLSDAGIRSLRTAQPSLLLIKAVHVEAHGEADTAFKKAMHYANMPELDVLLLDSRTTDRLGGTGKTHDWSISRQICQTSPKPVWLAGGLKPANVTKAVQEVSPAGVDANSGLETLSGAKCPEKIRNFVQNAKGMKGV